MVEALTRSTQTDPAMAAMFSLGVLIRSRLSTVRAANVARSEPSEPLDNRDRRELAKESPQS
jgi:hypothetical protein